jgi:hypothetical protein
MSTVADCGPLADCTAVVVTTDGSRPIIFNIKSSYGVMAAKPFPWYAGSCKTL